MFGSPTPAWKSLLRNLWLLLKSTKGVPFQSPLRNSPQPFPFLLSHPASLDLGSPRCTFARSPPRLCSWRPRARRFFPAAQCLSACFSWPAHLHEAFLDLPTFKTRIIISFLSTSKSEGKRPLSTVLYLAKLSNKNW